MKCGDILLVPYPFTDDSGVKLRPVVIVSSEPFNTGDGLVVLPVSSRPASDEQYAYVIQDAHPDFKATGLRQSSHVKWTNPLTISRSIVQRRLGCLSRKSLSDVQAMVRSVFS